MFHWYQNLEATLPLKQTICEKWKWNSFKCAKLCLDCITLQPTRPNIYKKFKKIYSRKIVGKQPSVTRLTTIGVEIEEEKSRNENSRNLHLSDKTCSLDSKIRLLNWMLLSSCRMTVINCCKEPWQPHASRHSDGASSVNPVSLELPFCKWSYSLHCVTQREKKI